MEWPIILALVLAIPIILFPVAYVSYLNVGAIYTAIREGRTKRTAPKPEKNVVSKAAGEPTPRKSIASAPAQPLRLGLLVTVLAAIYALAIFFSLSNLGWEAAVALAIALPVVFVPVGLVWYVNIGGVHWIIQEARERQQRRAEVLREAMSILAAAQARSVTGAAAGEGSFWTDKTPCWKMCSCAAQIREECPAFTAKSALPCWEVESTFCKLTAEGDEASGRDTTICQVCPVYLKYGEGTPIQLRPVQPAAAAISR